MQRIISFNGQLKKEVLSFGSSNRSFRYGDGLFESIKLKNGIPLFFDLHFSRLSEGIRLLGMHSNDAFTEENLYKEIIECARANDVFQSGRIRLQVFRKDGGLYKPNQNYFDYFIEIEPLANIGFELNQKGLMIGIYEELPKPINMLSSIKTTNALYYVLAGVFANKNNFDDALLLNQNGLLVEATSSNLFIVKDNIIYTPPLTDGPVNGIIRQVVLAMDIPNYHFKETSITPTILEKADEVFLSNAISGIQWVVGFGQKRFYNRVSRKIIEDLNSKVELSMLTD